MIIGMIFFTLHCDVNFSLKKKKKTVFYDLKKIDLFLRWYLKISLRKDASIERKFIFNNSIKKIRIKRVELLTNENETNLNEKM